MKRRLIAAAFLSLLTVAPARAADESGTPVPVAPETRPNPICLDPIFIDHTTIVDDSTILFHMKGGKIWKNTLSFKCPGLKIQGGFAYEVRGGTICSNMQTIRVLDRGAICSLGEFTPYTPPGKKPDGE